MFYKGEIPFIRLIVPLIIGIVLGIYFGNGKLSFFLEIALVLFLGLIFITSLVYKQANLFKRRWIPGVFVHLFILLASYVLTVRQADIYYPHYFANYQSNALIVTVTNEPQLTGDILRLETTVKQCINNKENRKVSGKLLIALKSDSLNPVRFTYGDLLMIPGKYNEVDPPFNPAEFNFKEYLITKQIYQQCFINQNQIRLLKKDTGNPIISFALQLRRQLVAKFYQYLENKEAASLASTLILGYRANLSKEVISAYSKTGTMHILSVSGMHVGIVFLVLNALLKPLRKIKKLCFLSAFIIISSVWFYAMITGFSPSVCRAAVMLSFIVLGKTFNKDLNTYNLLAISAFFLLLYNPYNLLDVGFQLSYLAVFGLIYLHPKIYHLFYIKNKFADSIWSYTALSLAAQLATFPISIYYFHQFPVYFLIGNLLVVLPVILIMYAGILFLFIPWYVLLKSLGYFLNHLIIWTNNILYFIEDLPFSSISGIWISKLDYILIYFVIAGIIWTALSANKTGVYICLGLILCLVTSLTLKNIGDVRNRELIFYSLRKNSAIAYIHHKKAYLINDLGNDEKTLQFSLKPVLDSRGVKLVKNISFQDTISDRSFRSSPLQMSLGNIRVLRWSRKMDNLVFNQIIRTDIVLISGNPKTNISDIKINVVFGMLLIDATNPDYKISKWKAEADSLKIPVRVLKKCPAYVLKF